MNIVRHLFGHLIESAPGLQVRGWPRYRYVDNGEPVDYRKPRPCKLCNKKRTRKGHDPCIANLPNVSFACCGHGVEDDHCGGAYVVFEGGKVIRGPFDHVAKKVHARQRKEQSNEQ